MFIKGLRLLINCRDNNFLMEIFKTFFKKNFIKEVFSNKNPNEENGGIDLFLSTEIYSAIFFIWVFISKNFFDRVFLKKTLKKVLKISIRKFIISAVNYFWWKLSVMYFNNRNCHHMKSDSPVSMT